MRVATRDYARPQRPKPTGRGRPPPRRAAPKPASSAALGLPLWVWMVVGLSVVMCAFAIYTVTRPVEPMDMAPSSEVKAEKTAKTIEIPPKEPSRFAFYEMLPSYEVVVPDDVLNPPKPKPGEARNNLPPEPAAAAVNPAPSATLSPDLPDDLKAAIAAEAATLPASKPITAADVKPAKKPEAKPALAAIAPAPASAPPQPTAQLAKGEQFLIQVAAYRTRSDAEQRVAALALAGLAARVEQVTIDDKDTWFRVRLGPYGSASAASAAQQSLKAQGFSGVVMKVKG